MPPTFLELRARLTAFKADPRVRRLRAALRLHHRLILALVVGLGIATMVVHWA